ncbi:hypothetical protein OH77DRAFT_1229537 [Trametes cingulata]|nr:hypothetical protein OH77DRAFT_1229537 [Trametes cingulata]
MCPPASPLNPPVVHHSDSSGSALLFVLITAAPCVDLSLIPCHRQRPRPSSQSPSAPSSSCGTPSTPSRHPASHPSTHPHSQGDGSEEGPLGVEDPPSPLLPCSPPGIVVLPLAYHAADGRTRTLILMRSTGTPGLRGAAQTEFGAALIKPASQHSHSFPSDRPASGQYAHDAHTVFIESPGSRSACLTRQA